MPRNNTTTQLPANEREILAELNNLRNLLQAHGGSQACAMNGQDILGIMRLCPGLSLDQWPALADKHGLREWLAVPMDKAEYPFLSHIQQALADLSYQTEHDPLTSLYNRRAFDRFLSQELERTRRSNASLALAILDLDDFKAVNDTYGHPCGDEVLVKTARILITSTRRYDVTARLGGEEFALIMPETGLIKARAIIERILETIRQERYNCGEAQSFRATCSAGLVCYKGLSSGPEPDLFDLADKALYQAKAEGKNQVVAAPLADLSPPRRESIVQSSEKKFLFTGS